jgi:hypothetical protein
VSLLTLLLVRLTWSQALRFLPLRLLVFPAIAFIVYLLHYDAQASAVVPPLLRTVLFILLIVLMLMAIRYVRSDSFKTTPTDILVIAMVGGVGVLYERSIVDAELAPMLVELVVLFYAAELFMRQMKNTWNCFTVGILAGLAILSARLLV